MTDEKFLSSVHPIYSEWNVRFDRISELRYDLELITRRQYYEYCGKLDRWKMRRIISIMRKLSWEDQIRFAQWSSEYYYLRFFLDAEQQSAVTLLGKPSLRHFEQYESFQQVLDSKNYHVGH